MSDVRCIPNPIPPITHPLGSALNQPNAEGFKFFQDKHGGNMFVRISAADQAKISVRDWGLPTGVYEGKMWRHSYGDLVWFGAGKEKDTCSINRAKIIGEL